ncbi:alpha/beta fold hydrolase [Trebonia sp.]|uniref:alpha/beta fold hydrolase n=1 Tax=Trebonia sp. TaxID=2767075 RepID=UPI003CC670EB
MRGFGDSGNEPGEYDSTTSAEDLHLLMGHLGVGPVHLTGQDISGATVFRLATAHPEDVLSLTAIEMGLPGFGLEMLADVTHGGAWHIGVLAAPGIPEMLLAGREREFLGQFAFPAMSATRERSPAPTSTSSPAPTRAPAAGAERPASTSRCCGKAPTSGLSPRHPG